MRATPEKNGDLGVANADTASATRSHYTRRFLPLPPQPSVVPFAENPLYTTALSSWREARRQHFTSPISEVEEEEEKERKIVASLPTSLVPLQSPPPVRLFHAYYGMGCDGSNVPVEDLSAEEVEKREGKKNEKETGWDTKKCETASMPKRTTKIRPMEAEHDSDTQKTLLTNDALSTPPDASTSPSWVGVHGRKYNDLRSLFEKTVKQMEDHHPRGRSSLLEAYIQRGVVLRWCAPSTSDGVSSTLPQNEGHETTSCRVGPPWQRCPSFPCGTVLRFPHATSPIAAVTCGRWRGGEEEDEEEEEVLWGITCTGALYGYGRTTTLFGTAEEKTSSPTRRTHETEKRAFGWERLRAVEKPVRMVGTQHHTVLALSTDIPASTHRMGIAAPLAGGAMARTCTAVVYCWGDNRQGQCMRDPMAFPFLRQPIRFGTPALGVQSLACGGSYGVMVYGNGVMGVWGTPFLRGREEEEEEEEEEGGGEAPSPTPSSPWKAKAVGDAKEPLWGGRGTFSAVLQPMPLRLPEKVVAVSAGPSHAAAVTDTGRVWTWGVGGRGRLGHGGQADEVVPRRVMEPCWEEEGIRAIQCGAQHTVALTTKGKVWVWGDNRYGQLGLAPSRRAALPAAAADAWEGRPTPFPSLATRSIPVMAIGCGTGYTWMLLSDGDLVGCGGVLGKREAVGGRRHPPSLQTCPVGRWRLSSVLPRPPRRLLPDYLCLSLSCGATQAAACVVPRQTSLYVIGGEHHPWWGNGEEGLAVWKDGRGGGGGDGGGGEATPPPLLPPSGVSHCDFPFSSTPAMSSPLLSCPPAGGGKGFFVCRGHDGRHLLLLRRSHAADTTREDAERRRLGVSKTAMVPSSLPASVPEHPTMEGKATCRAWVQAIGFPSRRHVVHPTETLPRHDNGEEIKKGLRRNRTHSMGDDAAMEAVASVSCGPDYAIAVTTEGGAFGWGVHGDGAGEEKTRQKGTVRSAATKTAVGTLFSDASPRWLQMEETPSSRCRIAQVSCGGTFVVLRMDNGTVYEHGCSGSGEGYPAPRKERKTIPTKGKEGGRKGKGGPALEDEGDEAKPRYCMRRVRGFYPTPSSLADGQEEEEEEEIIMVAAGDTHALALSCRGNVFGWGNGVLGHGPISAVSSVPRTVHFPSTCPSLSFPGETSMRSIGCGPVNSFTLFDNGELFVWGCNQYGQCGIGSGSEGERNETSRSEGKEMAVNPSKVVPTPWKVASRVQCAAFGPHTLVVILEDGSLAISGKVSANPMGAKQKEQDALFPDTSACSFCTLTRVDSFSCGWLHPLLTASPSLPSTHHAKNSPVVGISCVSGYDGVVVVGEINRPSTLDVRRAVDGLNAYLSGTAVS